MLQDYEEYGLTCDRNLRAWRTAAGEIITWDREYTNRLGLWLGALRFEPYLRMFQPWELPLPASSLLIGTTAHYHTHRKLLTMATMVCQQLSEESGKAYSCPVNLSIDMIGLENQYVEYRDSKGIKYRHFVVLDEKIAPSHCWMYSADTRIPITDVHNPVKVPDSLGIRDEYTTHLVKNWYPQFKAPLHHGEFGDWIKQIQRLARQ